MVLKILV